MDPLFTTIVLFLQATLFVLALFMELAKRNAQLVFIYALQSFIVASFLLTLGWHEQSWVLFAIVGATILFKCILATGILSRLIKKHDLVFVSSAHLSVPLLLALTLLLVFTVHSSFAPLFSAIVPGGEVLFTLAISAFFLSLLLAINHRGAFSQIVGILSAENSLVVFAALLNVHTELWLELGILGDIFAWMLIGSTFVSMVSKHFGTTDVSKMKELAE